jgi:hypothetical protein
MVDFPGLIGSQKRIAMFTGWSPPEEQTGFMSFAAPLSIGGVVEEGFNLEGSCFKQYRDCNVIFELVLARTPTRRRQPLERIEWRSLKGGHSNIRRRPPGLVRRTGPSHIHSFSLNYISDIRKMRGDNLPLAEDFYERCVTFDSLRDYVGRRLNVSNIEVVDDPDWDYGLFDDPPRFPPGS